MCIAWSRSIAPSGSMVTNGMSVRSSSGKRGDAAAFAAASSTSLGNSGVTPSSSQIAAMPARRLSAATPSATDLTLITLLAMPVTLPMSDPAVTGATASPADLPYPDPVLILLPPSEGKAAPTRGKPLDLSGLGAPGLTDARASVIGSLVALCSSAKEPGTPATDDDRVARAAQVLGLGATQLDLVALNASLESDPPARADHVYTGVLFDALGFATLSPAAKRRATTRVAVTSSLFGLVRPSDHIPSYRLSEIGRAHV